MHQITNMLLSIGPPHSCSAPTKSYSEDFTSLQKEASCGGTFLLKNFLRDFLVLENKDLVSSALRTGECVAVHAYHEFMFRHAASL